MWSEEVVMTSENVQLLFEESLETVNTGVLPCQVLSWTIDLFLVEPKCEVARQIWVSRPSLKLTFDGRTTTMHNLPDPLVQFV